MNSLLHRSLLAMIYMQTSGRVQSARRDGTKTAPYNIVPRGRIVFGEKMDGLLAVFAALLIISIPVVVTAQPTAEHDISLYAMGNYTTPSLGEESYDSVVRTQSNKTAMGTAGYFETWKHNNGLILGGSYTKTNSHLSTKIDTQVYTDTWALQRYKADALYERRFWNGKTFRPYLGLGGFLIVLWGGYAPAHSGVNASGWDTLRGVIAPVGIATRLNSAVSLKVGLFVDIGKASSYGDSYYTPSRNLMFEPQIGLSFKVGGYKIPREQFKN